MKRFSWWRIVTVMLMLSALLGCESKEEQLKQSVLQQSQQAEQALDKLGQQLSQGQIRNAIILKEYANVLADKKPALANLAQSLALDASRDGPIYQGLSARLADVKTKADDSKQSDELLGELAQLTAAATPDRFNDALTDPINVIADLSDGALSRVNAISAQAEQAANKTEMPAATQLVGNPNYGHWQTNSSGMSFWEWYGMYSMFSRVVDAIEYGSWSRNRRYSYYHDWGRSTYSSPKQIYQQNEVEQKTKKSYQAQGKSYTSPYAKPRSGAAGLSRASNTPVTSQRQSSYSKTKSTSSYSKTSSGTVRKSSSRTSRGASRGK